MHAGCTIPLFYASLTAKLAIWDATREEAISRLRNALNEYVIEEIKITASSQPKILSDEYFRKGEIHTGLFHERIGGLAAEEEHEGEEVAALSAVSAAFLRRKKEGLCVRGFRFAKLALVF